MKKFGYLRHLGLAALFAVALNTCTPSTQGGEMIPLKSRASGKLTSKEYFLDPSTVPLGTKFLSGTSSSISHTTLLGKSTVDTEFLVHLELIEGQLYVVSEGAWLTTTANGDTLYGTFRTQEAMIVVDGALVGSGLSTGSSVILGGTGRFEGATGHDTSVGTLTDQSDGFETLSYVSEGFISSVGSLKRNK